MGLAAGSLEEGLWGILQDRGGEAMGHTCGEARIVGYPVFSLALYVGYPVSTLALYVGHPVNLLAGCILLSFEIVMVMQPPRKGGRPRLRPCRPGAAGNVPPCACAPGCSAWEAKDHKRVQRGEI